MIQTADLTKKYGSLTAVDSLNLIVEPGELFGFLGSNGAGKTTTIRMLVGLLKPTSGRIIVANYDVQENLTMVKHQIGYLAQNPLLYDKLTGREFLRFLGGLYSIGEADIAKRSDELFELVELDSKADELIESYSGGMRRKIGLCGALIHRPKVLILDEPLAGLDPHSARRVKDVLRELCDQGTTVFLSTHILEIAERVCDKVAILDKGQLVVSGSVGALRSLAHSANDTTLEDLFLHLTGGDGIAQVASELTSD